jgi:peptidoglycan/xylan/chitin deacetylase (PgdA/CDA1 family)
MMKRDLVGYGRNRPDFTWPNGARLAVSLTVNFEEGAELSVEAGDGATERFGEVQSVQPPGVRDLAQESVFDYGMRAGIWRFLDAFEACRVPATFMMCGRAVERAPEIARIVVDAGHEPAVHGWRWVAHSHYEDREAERAEIVRTRAAIAAATGETPVGFMCRGGQSPWTRELLAELGFLYDSNALDDDLPYWSETACGRAILVVPYGYDTNDMKFFHPNGFVRPDDFSSYVGAALDVLLEEAARGRTNVLSIGFHTRIAGRPARFAAVQTILARLASAGDRVWIARRREIAAHAAQLLARPSSRQDGMVAAARERRP